MGIKIGNRLEREASPKTAKRTIFQLGAHFVLIVSQLWPNAEAQDIADYAAVLAVILVLAIAR